MICQPADLGTRWFDICIPAVMWKFKQLGHMVRIPIQHEHMIQILRQGAWWNIMNYQVDLYADMGIDLRCILFNMIPIDLLWSLGCFSLSCTCYVTPFVVSSAMCMKTSLPDFRENHVYEGPGKLFNDYEVPGVVGGWELGHFPIGSTFWSVCLSTNLHNLP